MISTSDFSRLPDCKNLQRICKAISVLDAILSQEWQYRYYSYSSRWSINEECLQMRNGSGEEMHILFRSEGCAINGFAHEFEQKDKVKLTLNLPSVFNEFIFGEPVSSIGTTFCLWNYQKQNWQVGELNNNEDNSEEMLEIFDGNPQTYIDWAVDYYEDGFKNDKNSAETVTKIYQGETLTKKMVLSLVNELEDWKQLKSDLDEINYKYKFTWF
jgi:hypothetical protein